MKCLKFLLVVLAGCLSGNAHADDRAVAEIYGDEVIPPKVTFGRSARSLSEVAENVTVITHEEIRRLQAKTVDDVLRYYPGVIPFPNRLPGDLSIPMVQGLPNRQCLVAYDGIPVNNLGDGAADIGFISVTSLDRIEIVKGPASSLWGRSVGAIINLVSREPDADRRFGGATFWTYGEGNTTSGHTHVSGTFDSTMTGYYFGGGYGRSDGFQPHVTTDRTSYYGKVTQDLGPKNDLTLLYARSRAERDLLRFTDMNVNGDNTGDASFAIARLHTRFGSDTALESTLYYYNLDVRNNFRNINPIPPFLPVGNILVQRLGIRETAVGLQSAWKLNTESYWLTAGFDGLSSSLRNTDFSLAPPPRNIERKLHPLLLGTYLSGGWNVVRDLTVTGSVRYDYSSESDNTVSPSLGLIYRLDDETILRGSFGYGYSLPTLANEDTVKPEHLWRYQVGVETNHIPGLWLKTNLFYDRTENIKLNLKFFDLGPATVKNLVRQGYEVEAKTIPVFNTSFSVGYTFTDIYDRDSGKVVEGLPRHDVVFTTSLRTELTDILLAGRYVFWNSSAGRDDMVWDILLSRRILRSQYATASLQLAARNIFDGAQYSSPNLPNQPRWVEGGIRVEF